MHCSTCGWELDPSEIDVGVCSNCFEDERAVAAEDAYIKHLDAKQLKKVTDDEIALHLS